MKLSNGTINGLIEQYREIVGNSVKQRILKRMILESSIFPCMKNPIMRHGLIVILTISSNICQDGLKSWTLSS